MSISSTKDQSNCDANNSVISLSETLLSEDNLLTTTKENANTIMQKICRKYKF